MANAKATVACDQVAVEAELWRRVFHGDVRAAQELRSQIDGLVLYFHMLPLRSSEVLVPVRDLEAAGIIGSVTIEAKVDG